MKEDSLHSLLIKSHHGGWSVHRGTDVEYIRSVSTSPMIIIEVECQFCLKSLL